MHLIRISSGMRTAATMLVAVLAALGLAACGSSSSSTSTNASATAQGQSGAAGAGASSGGAGGSSSTSSTKSGQGAGAGGATATQPGGGGPGGTGPGGAGAGPAGPGGTRFSKVRECLHKQGITLPRVRPGGGPYGPPRGLLGSGSGPQLPKGMTKAQYEAAVHKCGGVGFGQGRFFGGGARLKSPAFKAALAKFAECLRENGVKVPAPNTSGTGPIFDTKGINTQSAQFKAAQMKCASELRGALRPGAKPGGSPTR